MNERTTNLLKACKNFVSGWSHFCECIDFDQSNLDADAIRWMNEVPGKIQTAFDAFEQPAEQPTELPAQVEQPAESAVEPESKPGSGVVSEPAESESKPGAGVVKEPEKSENKPGSGVV